MVQIKTSHLRKVSYAIILLGWRYVSSISKYYPQCIMILELQEKGLLQGQMSRTDVAVAALTEGHVNPWQIDV